MQKKDPIDRSFCIMVYNFLNYFKVNDSFAFATILKLISNSS